MASTRTCNSRQLRSEIAGPLSYRKLCRGSKLHVQSWTTRKMTGSSSSQSTSSWTRISRGKLCFSTFNDDLITSDAYDQEVISIITTDGRIVRIPGNMVMRPQVTSKIHRMPTWEEQGICIGSSFQLAATNGHDPARRINIEGFCQSVDYLFESIEDTVRQQRGEILLEERELKGGLHEILKLTVAVPFLWGVPPQLDMLR